MSDLPSLNKSELLTAAPEAPGRPLSPGRPRGPYGRGDKLPGHFI